MTTDRSGILYLFVRPTEPVYVPKGDKKVVFDIPSHYLPEKHRLRHSELFSHFHDSTVSKIKIKQITLPDLRIPMQLDRRQPFSLFIPRHRKIAARLIDIFMGMKTYEDLLSVAVYCRDRVNPNLFIYALSVAMLHRPDTKDLPIPPLSLVFPDKYLARGVFSRAREEASIPNHKTIKMTTDRSGILYLFVRPTEPVYVPKGDKKVVFDIPSHYLPEKHRLRHSELFSHFHDSTVSKIKIKQITLPDLRIPMQLDRRQPFSLFIPRHRKIAARLIDIFMGMKTYEDLLSVAVYCRDRVNPNLFIYALSVAMLHRPDTKDLPIPPLSLVFPDKYLARGVFSRAREEASIPVNLRETIDISKYDTATDVEVEHRVAYWREDIGINLHHWHWHLVYPHDSNITIVNKDRRGELFYYMHQQMMARYNCERLCNRLGRVKRFINWREPIPEAYFPKLDSLVASRTWPARPTGAVLRDVNRQVDEANFDIQDLERWRDRIYEAIHTGSVINTKGERIPLTEKDGIDVLGNILESSMLSPNRNIYGDLHNFGHMALSTVHDPDHRHLESFGVMGDNATAMRDPIFYRWHAFIDDVFQEHKDTLPKYTVEQLDFLGVEIADIKLTTNDQPNVLNTFWTESEMDLSYGVDFKAHGPIRVRFTHLNHTEFLYTIVVNNRNNEPRKGTVRIFIGPKEDERGMPFTYSQQKNLMIEMDKFAVTLQPGENKIERKSTESSVTIPFKNTFPDLDDKRPINGDSSVSSDFCSCGWPQHMLVPKGKKEGFRMQLFVMISDYTDDAVEQDESTSCRTGVSFCGLRDRKYPDARSMGYPFDRQPRDGVKTLAQFLTGNMKVGEVTVRFSDTIVPSS
ncbi:phenoloxidase 1-like [Ceratina calcarata]|uniref:Phenoloxidase 1-like n=1 Tax=Ceratina calcarata TaxID=156304 RepID=A0AAJ7N4I5_9HYME|nr:phenoloxidase 1-like [Ceratina calcarata]